ncbi:MULTISPECIES: DUF5690 family protein [Chitinophagaceae]
MLASTYLKAKLATAPSWMVSIYAALTAFGVYFCMYAFRKPITASGFEGLSFGHVNYKVWLVIAQVIGYALSKFYGIRFISGMQLKKRAITIVLLILVAWTMLLFFALVPAPYNIVFLLLNGFPLGMVWGLVFSYLEGRRSTEFTGAVLSISFILSSGVVKSIGKALMLDRAVSQFWMPFFAGALFIVPLLVCVWLLNLLPPPSVEDIRQRTERKPMNANERKKVVKAFFPGLVIIVITYSLLTILRDFRDNFSNELYNELGLGNDPSIFSRTEIPISLILLLCMSLLICIRSNIKAFLINHWIVMSGYLIALVSTILFKGSHISPFSWILLVGTGLYMSYVPFNCLYFERMIASFKMTSNFGFLMYIADSFGYLGSVIILFVHEFWNIRLPWVVFFSNIVLGISAVGIVGTSIAAMYFKRKYDSLHKHGKIATDLPTLKYV